MHVRGAFGKVPLIAKWKGCEAASHWVMEFTLYHQLLQRALAGLDKACFSDGHGQKEDSILSAIHASEQAREVGAHQRALDELLDADPSWAAINSRRARSVQEVLTKPDIQDVAIIIFFLCHNLEEATNQLLKRSADQSDFYFRLEFMTETLTLDGSTGPAAELEQFFLHYCNGGWGTSLLASYGRLLDAGVHHMMYLTGTYFMENRLQHFFRHVFRP